MTSGDTLPRFSVGKILISLIATEAAAGPYLADWKLALLIGRTR